MKAIPKFNTNDKAIVTSYTKAFNGAEVVILDRYYFSPLTDNYEVRFTNPDNPQVPFIITENCLLAPNGAPNSGTTTIKSVA